jgi:predicted dehydrogenase
MPNKQYRIAIIGIGAIAGMHARAIGDIPHTTLVAGSCRNEEKGQKFAAQFKCNWYGDYEKMLDSEKPDLVTICTPSGLHLEPTLACARRGVHVLCEKPLEITTARVDQMIEAMSTAGILLGGIFPQRYNPVVQTIHKAAAGGRFGQLACVSSHVPWWRDDAYYAPNRWQGKMQYDGGGAFMNQSIHGIDAIQWIASAAMNLPDKKQNPVAEVFCFTARRGHDPKLIEVEDTAVAVLKFRDGSLGQLLGATSMWPGSLKRIQVAGRDGTAEVLEDELTTFRFRAEQPTDEEARKKFKATSHGGGAADPMAIDYSNHTRNIADFVGALDDARWPTIDGTEARKAVEIVEACYKSAQTGGLVRIGT